MRIPFLNEISLRFLKSGFYFVIVSSQGTGRIGQRVDGKNANSFYEQVKGLQKQRWTKKDNLPL